MQIKVGATLYPIATQPLEFGELRLLKREYGYVPGRDELDLNDPDHLAALVYAAMRQADPDTAASTLISRINRIRVMEIVGDDGAPITTDDQQSEPGDPTPAPSTPTPPPVAKRQSDAQPVAESVNASS